MKGTPSVALFYIRDMSTKNAKGKDMTDFSDYMVQHILYIKAVEKCINQHAVFAHKQPTECAFGKMFYETLKPNIDGYSEKKRQLIEQLEQVHIQFHESARHIDPDDPDIEKHQQDAWYYSSKLINLLGSLEKTRD
jgi:hypothetical protein